LIKDEADPVPSKNGQQTWNSHPNTKHTQTTHTHTRSPKLSVVAPLVLLITRLTEGCTWWSIMLWWGGTGRSSSLVKSARIGLGTIEILCGEIIITQQTTSGILSLKAPTRLFIQDPNEQRLRTSARQLAPPSVLMKATSLTISRDELSDTA
jgi:hypothetical protein